MRSKASGIENVIDDTAAATTRSDLRLDSKFESSMRFCGDTLIMGKTAKIVCRKIIMITMLFFRKE